MTQVTVTTVNGTNVSFEEKDPMQGGLKDVYFTTDRRHVVAFYRNPLDYTGVERLEKLVTTYRQGIFEREGGDFWKDYYCWPEEIIKYNNKVGLMVPVYQPCFFFGKDTNLDGAEKEGKWFASAKNFNRFVPANDKGTLLSYLRISLNLSRAVRRLHAAGLAHSDLSYRNCLVDPATGNACIIDIDGLVVPGLFPPDVIGTPDFIAPEVVATMSLPRHDPQRKLPCRETDQHALAVLIYLYLFHRHPLRGSKVHSQDNATQELLEMGEKALFIENPRDQSNRFKVKHNDQDFLPWVDTDKLPYTIMGPYLKALFDRAFIDGLHSPNERPIADEWEKDLVKTLDLIQPCENPSCPKGWYVFQNTSSPMCPYCGTKFKGQLPVLDLYSTRDGSKFMSDNHRLMVYNNQYIRPWHVDRNIFPDEKLLDHQKAPVGYFSFHKKRWLFVNQRLDGLKDLNQNKDVPIGQAVELTDGLRLLLKPGPGGRLVNVTLVKA
ncbi:MAG: kinase [Deltaproteobacteria bacterium]|jgi:serine/threonine protein kinase|nr:kinase [Deltaproteobacteria bacterium]